MSTTMVTDRAAAAVSADGGVTMAGQGARRSRPQDAPAVLSNDMAAAAGSADAPPHSIEQMRVEIDAIDAELVRLIQRRTALSRAIGAVRASEGGTRIVYSREMKILDRFTELGPAGTDLGMLLLSMGRGKLGRR